MASASGEKNKQKKQRHKRKSGQRHVTLRTEEYKRAFVARVAAFQKKHECTCKTAYKRVASLSGKRSKAPSWQSYRQWAQQVADGVKVLPSNGRPSTLTSLAKASALVRLLNLQRGLPDPMPYV